MGRIKSQRQIKSLRRRKILRRRKNLRKIKSQRRIKSQRIVNRTSLASLCKRAERGFGSCVNIAPCCLYTEELSSRSDQIGQAIIVTRSCTCDIFRSKLLALG